MKDFHFQTPINLYVGKNSLQAMPGMIKPFTDKVLLVYGGGSIKRNGAYDAITSVLNAAGIECVDFGGNTKALYSNVVKGVALARQENVGCVIGVGGSTCMDMAKIIAFGAKNDDLGAYMTGEKKRTFQEDRLLIGAIPTFPSGGSDAGFGAGVDDDETGESLDLGGYVPDFSILNPEFAYSLDPVSSAYGAMVSFVQISINHMGGSCAISERITEGLLDVIRESLAVAQKDPSNYEARANQMYAATFGTNGIPGKGKDLSWTYGVYNYSGIPRKLMNLPYRKSFVVFYPSWLKAASKYHSEDIKKYMVRVWDVDAALDAQEACAVGVQKMKDYYESIGIPSHFRSYGKLPTKQELIRAIEAEGIYNPMPMDEIIAMFEDCMGTLED